MLWDKTRTYLQSAVGGWKLKTARTSAGENWKLHARTLAWPRALAPANTTHLYTHAHTSKITLSARTSKLLSWRVLVKYSSPRVLVNYIQPYRCTYATLLVHTYTPLFTALPPVILHGALTVTRAQSVLHNKNEVLLYKIYESIYTNTNSPVSDQCLWPI